MEADARSDGEGRALTDTIYALSSGTPPAAVAVVRISGPRANAALQLLTGRLPEPRLARLARLRDGDEVLDNALVIRFPGPASATGEDVAELHLHGGRSVIAGVLAALGRCDGLRPAEPGEFTRRAFENGRIDLAEAEGLADLLEAETEWQRRQALALAGGALSRRVATWQRELLDLAAQVEAALDFSDEDDVVPLSAEVHDRLAALRADIESWLARPAAERLKDGVRVVIAGPPNAGKSSLFNALVGRDAAITSAFPGTTRDLVEAPVAFEGVPFLLVDTAGLREAENAIESVGVERARASASAADLVIWLGRAEDAPAQAIRVQSKCDLGVSNGKADLAVSAKTGEGLGTLIRMLIRRSRSLFPKLGEVAINVRHRAHLEEAAAALDDSKARDLLILAEALRGARVRLDRITGTAGVEQMLNALFARFCLGK